jgi:hypothetical protein
VHVRTPIPQLSRLGIRPPSSKPSTISYGIIYMSFRRCNTTIKPVQRDPNQIDQKVLPTNITHFLLYTSPLHITMLPNQPRHLHQRGQQERRSLFVVNTLSLLPPTNHSFCGVVNIHLINPRSQFWEILVLWNGMI